MAILLELNDQYIEVWHNFYTSETKRTGYLATFQLANKKQLFYGLNDIDRLLKEAAKRKEDVYLSLNAFKYGSRTTKELKQIRNIGVDIDCYKIGLSADQAAERVQDLIVEGKIPNPNLVIRSGRGLQLVYSIVGGASPKMAFLSEYITNQYIAELKDLGADTAATGPSRVFRLPGSINSKNGRLVTVETWRKLEYSLEELYSFCTPLEKPKKRRKPRKPSENKIVPFTVPGGLMNLHSLNFSRKTDLEKLVQLRNGEMTGHRNTILYIYSYISTLYAKNKADTFYYADQLNSRFTDPLKKKDVQTVVDSAFKDAMAYFEELVKRDFKSWYKYQDKVIKPMKNSTIIEKLAITADEMAEMLTIIGKEEKQARNTGQKRKKRREQGVLPRGQYLEQQKDQTEDKLWLLETAMKHYPEWSNYKLAEHIGISESYVRRLKKKL